MTRPLVKCLAAFLACLSSCTPPGKPKPVPNGGLPTKMRAFGKLYVSNCEGCHGETGILGPAPPLNDPLFIRIVPENALLEVIENGRPGTPMPAFLQTHGGRLDPEQAEVLAHGIKNEWPHSGGPENPPSYLMTTGGDASRGATLFATACRGCHGENGTGGAWDGKPVGPINDASYLTLTSDQVLRRYIITGRSDLGMPNYAEKTGRPADFKPLTEQDVTDLTEFLASWRKSAAR